MAHRDSVHPLSAAGSARLARRPFLRVAGALAASAMLPSGAGSAVSAQGMAQAQAGGAYRTGLTSWRSADQAFDGWRLDGASLAADGSLTLDPFTARIEDDPYGMGGYQGRNFYSGGTYLVGEATSPAMAGDFVFTDAIPSWNADVPPGAWVEIRLRVRALNPERWTRWYSLGVWAPDASTVERHSVDRQSDADADVATDTLVLADPAAGADQLQLQMRLFSADGASLPVLRSAAVATSTTPVGGSGGPGDPARWGRVLGVAECSQMVYPDGGEVWCSPTSTSMVLAYWGRGTGSCEPTVRAAVAGTYDWLYRGNGNWPFNTAYAASQGPGLEAYVARFASLAQAEEWIAAGVPVIVSYAWGLGELANAPLASAGGHIGVLVGFDDAGNPVVNDPAAPSDGTVRRVYRRDQFEHLWRLHSGGTVYLVYPTVSSVPRL